MPDQSSVIEELRKEVRQLRAEIERQRADELLTTAQAAELLHLSPHAVRQAAYRKTLPAIRVGGRLRFRRGDLVRK